MTRITSGLHYEITLEDRVKKTISISQTPISELCNKLLKLEAGNIGIICNTVRNARILESYLKSFLPETTNIYLYHAQFTIAHRNANSNHILEALGKTAKSPAAELKIFIGTQVLEQSLDIDFDLLYTENAPIDLILQRAGRLHRHSYKRRPDQLSDPELIIIKENDLLSSYGSNKIYGKYLLHASEQSLNKRRYLTLPDDISKIIEEVYAPLDKTTFQDLWTEYQSLTSAKTHSASIFQIPDPEKISNLYGWLSGGTTSEHAAEAKVRDGISGLELILLIRKSDKALYYYGRDGGLTPVPDQTPNYYQSMDIAQSAIRLPYYLASEELVETLEKEFKQENIFLHWQQTSLDGELPIILHEETPKTLQKWTISYNRQTGLGVERRND